MRRVPTSSVPSGYSLRHRRRNRGELPFDRVRFQRRHLNPSIARPGARSEVSPILGAAGEPSRTGRLNRDRRMGSGGFLRRRGSASHESTIWPNEKPHATSPGDDDGCRKRSRACPPLMHKPRDGCTERSPPSPPTCLLTKPKKHTLTRATSVIWRALIQSLNEQAEGGSYADLRHARPVYAGIYQRWSSQTRTGTRPYRDSVSSREASCSICILRWATTTSSSSRKCRMQKVRRCVPSSPQAGAASKAR